MPKNNTLLLALLLSLAPTIAHANDYDTIFVDTEHASVYLDAAVQSQDASGVAYLARFLRAARHLPRGVHVSVACPDQSIGVRQTNTPSTPFADRVVRALEREFQRDLERPMRTPSRLRTCLARAARIIRRVVPSFQPAHASGRWYSLELERVVDLAVPSLVRLHYLGSTRPYAGFFLTRADAENALEAVVREGALGHVRRAPTTEIPAW